MRILLLGLTAIVLAVLLMPERAMRLARLSSAWLAPSSQPARPVGLSPDTATINAPAPVPLHVTVAGKTHDIRLDALLRYGASSAEALCAAGHAKAAGQGGPAGGEEPDQNGWWMDIVCERGSKSAGFPRGDAALMQAAILMAQALGKPGQEQEALARDANGLILLGLRSGAFAAAPLLPAALYRDLAAQARDGRLHEIAGELWLATGMFCEPDAAACRTEADSKAGRELIDAGRWFNDPDRLKQAASLLEAALARGKDQIEPKERFNLQNRIGNAYSYASTFARPEERLALTQRALAALEPALPYADARAPSFSSAMLWQNLGASYVDRGQVTGDKGDFERGVAFYEKSLPLFDRANYRQSWARAKSNMGAARSRIAAAEHDLALHDAAMRDHGDSIAAFEEGHERLDAAYSRYRLAQALNGKATTAAALAARLSDGEAEQRVSLEATASASRAEALSELATAAAVFRQAGSKDYLARVERLTAEVERSTVGKQP